MKLAFRKLGNGKPLFILHGLFGSSDNWQTLGRKFAENFTVYLIDQRNHGRSPHSPEHNYKLMSDDFLELTEAENIDRVMLIGHSMGGKTAMYFAVSHPEKVEKMVVADISPKKYPITNQDIIDALEKVNLAPNPLKRAKEVKSRKEVEEILSQDIKEPGTLQFLLKNLYWNDPEGHTLKEQNVSFRVPSGQKLAWRFNLEALKANIALVGEQTPMPSTPLTMPVLFIKGSKSDHIFKTDINLINAMFSNAEIITIPDAGHWVHADKPLEFYNIVRDFLLTGKSC